MDGIKKYLIHVLMKNSLSIKQSWCIKKKQRFHCGLQCQ